MKQFGIASGTSVCTRYLFRIPMFFLHVIAVALLITFSFGQTQTSSLDAKEAVLDAKVKSTATFQMRVNEVDLSFTARDRHNRWVTDLSQEDISVLDNGKPPKSILTFQSRADLPLRVGLLIDTSDSVSRQLEFEKKSAILFLKQVLNPATDSAFVVGFSNEATLRQGLTSDVTALSTAIENLPLGGSTALYDAVHYACGKLEASANGQVVHRVLILLTDGEDNSSHFYAREVINAALQANVVIIALNTNGEPNSSDPRYRDFKEMADMSGGIMLKADSQKQVAKAFKEIQEQLRSHYFMAYKPAELNQDGSYRKIRLKARRRGLHIFYRHGYFAPASLRKHDE
jgi:Ca-activated chloride channel homolog